MANLFEQAKAKPVKIAKAAKTEEIHYDTPGLDKYAQIDALEKQLETLKKTLKAEVEGPMFDHFVENKGQNYKGKDVLGSKASLELRKRDSRRGLDEVELNLCAKYNISTQKVEGDFKINLAGLSQKKMEEVSKAISSVKGLPDDFIEFDASKERTITTENSIDDIFKLNDKEVIRTLLPIVGTTAIKARTPVSIGTIIETASKFLGVEK
jgi:hypothetical protein